MKLFRLLVSWETSLRIITILCLVLLIESVGLCLVGLKLLKHRERVVVVPPLGAGSPEISVAWSSANQEYLKSFALYVATLVGNITPENVQFVAQALGRFFSPTIYTEVKTRLLALAKDETWVTSAQSNFFSPRQVIYEPQTERIFVVGDIIVTGFKTLPERKNVTYEMIIRIVEGFPRVEYFTSYEGQQPHTLQWILSQPEDVKAQYKWLLDKAEENQRSLRSRR